MSVDARNSDSQLSLLAQAIEHVNDVVLVTEAHPITGEGPRIVYVNRAFERQTGYSRDEVIGKTPRIMQGPATSKDARERIRLALAECRPVREELVNYTKDGREFVVELEITPMLDDRLNVTHFVAVQRDVTERKTIESDLRIAASAFANANEAMMVVEAANEEIIAVNRAFEMITGYEFAEVFRQQPSILASGRHDREFFQTMRRLLRLTGNWQGEIWNRRRSGELFLECLSISSVYDESGQRSHYVAIFNDATKDRQFKASIEYLARYDLLTGLPNRPSFMKALNERIQGQKDKTFNFAVVVVDVDRFKQINECLGHQMGDLAIQAVAQRIKGWLQEDQSVCRLAGDEFAFVLGFDTATDLEVRLTAFRQEMSRRYVLPQGELHIAISVGVSLYGNDGLDAAGLLMAADTALNAAKENGRNRTTFYVPAMNAAARERLTLTNALYSALERNELELFYQPRIQLASGDCAGFEALLRWHHPELGMISPQKFIPIAEETGLIVPIGDWVIQQACRQLRAWADQYGERCSWNLAVNLSAAQLAQEQLPERLKQLLHDYELPPQRLIVELTESVLMKDPEGMLKVLIRIADVGVQIALDDFGTGYSSLAYLKRLPLQCLKIDRSFVTGLPHGQEDIRIVATILQMAKNFGFKTVAEGVETLEQRQYLDSVGCDEAQGFLFSKPVPVSELECFIQAASSACESPGKSDVGPGSPSTAAGTAPAPS